jgi:Flp pilus assembly protein TadG
LYREHDRNNPDRQADRMMRILQSLRRDQRGNSFIEMGLIAPVLAALLVGTVDISRATSTKLQLEQAAQRAIERAQRTSYSTTLNSTLQSEATTAAGIGSSATVTAWAECNHSSTHIDYDTGTCNATDSYARYVNVSVQKSFTPLFGTRFFPGHNTNGTVTVRGSATVRTQ